MRTPLPHVLLLTTRGVLSCVRGVRRKGMVVTSVDGKVPANSDEAISMVTSKSRPLTLGAPSPSALLSNCALGSGVGGCRVQ